MPKSSFKGFIAETREISFEKSLSDEISLLMEIFFENDHGYLYLLTIFSEKIIVKIKPSIEVNLEISLPVIEVEISCAHIIHISQNHFMQQYI